MNDEQKLRLRVASERMAAIIADRVCAALDFDKIAASAVDAADDLIAEIERTAGVVRECVRPSVLFRPRLSIDGNQWCALYGDNLQDGVAGFGDTPEKAMEDFDSAWLASLRRTPMPEGE